MTGNFRSLLLFRLRSEFEIYILMIVVAVWYLLNIGGAIEGDAAVFAWQGHFFVRGNMPAEQFRPMGRYFFGMGQLLFGRTTFGTKFFVFVLGILTIYLAYRAAKFLGNRVYGFFSALILSLIPLYGDLSVSGLMDIILTFFGMLLLFFTFKWIDEKDAVKKQRFLFLVGALSVCTVATKLYGFSFSIVVFLFILHREWRTIKTLQFLKRKNIFKRLKKHLIYSPLFIVLGVLIGLLLRAQLSDYWESAGEKGREDVLGILPGFLESIVLDMNGSSAYVFFLLVGILFFVVVWILVALVGKESVRAIKSLIKGNALPEKFHVLIYFLGALIAFVIIYAPYLYNPIEIFSQLMLVQTTNLSGGPPKVIGGVVYEKPPWWTYLYWTNKYLGTMFSLGLSVSVLYTAFRLIRREKIAQKDQLLFLYTFIPLLLLSILTLKNKNYFAILFPLYTVYIVIQVGSIAKRAAGLVSSKWLKDRTSILPTSAIILLMLLPGPLWMTLSDSTLGYDSGYDEAGELVTDYVITQAGVKVFVVALDRYALEFYLSDETLNAIEVIPLFSDNYSVDSLGHPNRYYPETILYNMTISGMIDLIVDNPQEYDGTDSIIRDYVLSNAQRTQIINQRLAVYYMK